MAADQSSKALIISRAGPSDLDEVHEFHYERAVDSDYLWPRDRDAFEELIEERGVFVLRDGASIAGVAYYSDENRNLHYEFGGVYLDESVRGLGAAAALGKVVIATLYVFLQPLDLIAHVHQFNTAPRRLLSKELGFYKTEEKISLPGDEAPENMKKNEDGDVVGEVFLFRTPCLADYASWLSHFEGTIKGREGQASLEIDAFVGRDRQRVCQILRSKAGSSSRID